jgi:hypothetical protein
MAQSSRLDRRLHACRGSQIHGIPELVDLLDAEYPESPAAALGAIGPAAIESAPALARLAGADSRRVSDRWSAAYAHARVTGRPDLVLERASADLNDPPPAAFRALAAVGPAAEGYRDRVREQLDARDEWTRVEAAHALWRITGDPTRLLTC